MLVKLAFVRPGLTSGRTCGAAVAFEKRDFESRTLGPGEALNLPRTETDSRRTRPGGVALDLGWSGRRLAPGRRRRAAGASRRFHMCDQRRFPLALGPQLPYISRLHSGVNGRHDVIGERGMTTTRQAMLRARQQFGKYVIERRLGEGGFAVVYQARDTIEGIRVALKVPYPHLLTGVAMEALRNEVRVAARLEHPNILPLKYADYIGDRLVIVTALGEMTLHERLQRRLSVETGLLFAEQMLAAVAYAHEHRIIHCDIKPDNFLVFAGNRLRLTDFGIARVALRTLKGSGTGTVGYIAPEQAMGRPSFRSDVFSLGLILYRMFSGVLPEWPYDWPPPGLARLRRRLYPELISLIRKALELNARKRYQDAGQMLAAYQRIKVPSVRHCRIKHRTNGRSSAATDWQRVRRREFQRRYGTVLQTRHTCCSCQGPVAETMSTCPWCGKRLAFRLDETNFPSQCPRCYRGMKSDWYYCPWCYGPGFEPLSSRHYSDRRYSHRCSNPRCERRLLMPFMRYCPWCHCRVKRKWKIEGSSDTCARCGWGVVASFWSFCPWCALRLGQ